MAIPTILARLAAGLAQGAAAGVEAEGVAAESALMDFAKHLGIRFTEGEGMSVPVNSSCISLISYQNDTITVVFKRGGARSYDYVGTVEEFIAFVMAPSKGEFFNANFRDR